MVKVLCLSASPGDFTTLPTFTLLSKSQGFPLNAPLAMSSICPVFILFCSLVGVLLIPHFLPVSASLPCSPPPFLCFPLAFSSLSLSTCTVVGPIEESLVSLDFLIPGLEAPVSQSETDSALLPG